MNPRGNFFVFIFFIFAHSFLHGQNADYSAAKSAYIKGDFLGAIELYSKSLEKELDYRTFMGRAQCYIEVKEYHKAIADYGKAIELSPEDSRIFYNRGACFLEMKEEQAAYADFDKAILLDPANFYAYNSRGYLYMSKDSLEKAEEDFMRAISLNLNFRSAYLNLGDLYLKQGLDDVALELVIEFLQHNPDDYIVLSYIAELYQQQRNYELAAKFYFTSLNMEPNQSSAIENLSVILVEKLKQYEHAITFIEKVKASYNSPSINYLLGMSYLAIADYAKSLAAFKLVKKERKEGTYENTESLIVTCLVEINQVKEAMVLLDSLEKTSYKLSETYLQKSLVYLKQESYKESLKYLDLAIEVNPKMASYLQKGYLLHKLGKSKKALELYTELDTTRSFKIELLEAKATSYLALEQKDLACDCWYKTVLEGRYEYAPNYIEVCKSELDSNQFKVLSIIHLMNVYKQKGISYKEEKDFDFLVEFAPNVFDFHLWRGVYLKAHKKFDLAIKDFSKCIELNPNRFEGYFFASNSMLEKGDSSAFITTVSLGIFKTNSTDLLYSRALFYKRIGDIEYAFNDLKEIVSIAPNYSNAYYQLGLLFIDQNQLDKACKYLKQALLFGNSKAKLEYKISCQ